MAKTAGLGVAVLLSTTLAWAVPPAPAQRSELAGVFQLVQEREGRRAWGIVIRLSRLAFRPTLEPIQLAPPGVGTPPHVSVRAGPIAADSKQCARQSTSASSTYTRNRWTSVSAIAVTSLALVDRALEGGTPAFSTRTPPQGVSIELDNPAEAAHAHREVGRCSSL